MKLLLLAIPLALSFSATLLAVDFTPPIGIPDPADSWGTLDPIRTDKPDTKTYCPGWHAGTPRANTRAAGDARNAYYIDNTHPSATDSSNTYGYPTKPRLTIPNAIAVAGDYFEIHGDGNPAAKLHVYSSPFNLRGIGTAASPIWYVGIDSPVVTAAGQIGLGTSDNISYHILDGIQWRGVGLDIRPRFSTTTIDHIAYRNCLFYGNAASADSTGINVGVSSLKSPAWATNDIVFSNCDLGYYGDKNLPGEECCLYVSFHATRIWMLDSEIHDAAEDGMQFSHAGKHTSSNLYVGRCEIHHNLTNAIDIKGTGDHVVMSQNYIHDHEDVWTGGISSGSLRSGLEYGWSDVSGSPDFSNCGAGSPPYTVGAKFVATATTPKAWGRAVVDEHKATGTGETNGFHYSGSSGGGGSYLNYPEDISFLFNTVEGGRMGIATSSCGRLRIVGNTFKGTRWVPTYYTDSPSALDIRGIKDDTWIVNNTFYDCERTIRLWDAPAAYNPATTYYRGNTVSYSKATYVCINENGGSGSVGNTPSDNSYWRAIRIQIFGNIIANTYNGKPDITIDGSALFADSVDVGHNDIFNPSGVKLIGYSLRSSDITRNPLLSNPMNGNFTIPAGSPAKDAGSAGVPLTVYDDYFERYGIDIKVDKSGLARPVGAKWDIGAYEYNIDGGSDGGLAPIKPNKPEVRKGSESK